ncbi:DUF833-domain-containing protein [Aulographum hederae CBS 113979]|uniref:DUF833-domain-containing protein n=1 Tax=Aulographum hederae CBS 113979 TaxID=1176131 RepID=A0A6G1H1M5_9PEZI|nr:DUF833-domain-containing protein [Aulographum hederae CBS 113979]
MCLAVISTSHPQYPLILISNRDEFLGRPTAPADWWEPPNSQVLGGRDLHRSVRGTWLGITKQGRLACLTNFREEGQPIVEGARSRGAIVNAFLTTPADSLETPEEFAKRLVEEEGVTGVGGFSLLYGQLDRSLNEKTYGRGLAIVSNRTPDVNGLIWVGRDQGEVHGLSNSHFGDRTWPKVVEGEELLREAISASAASDETQEALVQRLFDILSIGTIRTQKEGEDFEIYLRQLRNSIFIPALGSSKLAGKRADEIAAADKNETIEATSGIYGTQKQTIILVSREGKVTFTERTVFDAAGRRLEKGQSDRRFKFDIEGW